MSEVLHHTDSGVGEPVLVFVHGLACALEDWDAAHMDDALGAVRAPLLLIQSTVVDAQHNRVPLQPGQSTPWIDRVRAGVPAARVEIIPGVGYFTMHEAGDRVTGLIAEFAAGA